MEPIRTAEDLSAAIIRLAAINTEHRRVLKDDLHLTYESITPLNILNAAFKEITRAGDLKNKLVKTTIALIAGYLSETAFLRVSHGPLKKFLGSILLFGVTNMVVKHPGVIDGIGRGLNHIIQKWNSGKVEADLSEN